MQIKIKNVKKQKLTKVKKLFKINENHKFPLGELSISLMLSNFLIFVIFDFFDFFIDFLIIF